MSTQHEFMPANTCTICSCQNCFSLKRIATTNSCKHMHTQRKKERGWEREREREWDRSRILIKSLASKRKPSKLYGSHSAQYQRFGVGHFIFRFLVFHHVGVFSLVVSCPASHLLFLHYLLVVSFQFHNQWLWVYSVGPGYGVCLCYFDFSKFAFIFNMHLRCCFRVGEFCFLVSFSLHLSSTHFSIFIYTPCHWTFAWKCRLSI